MIKAFQWDLGRQVERLDWLLEQLPRYADWGYRELYLHLEDAVEFPSLPGVARRDAYSHRQLGRLVGEAARVGIGVVPIVNLLGHTQYLIKVPGLRDLNELRAPDGSPLAQGQICPLHPRTLEVADALIGDVSAFCTAGKVHVGLDESFSLGRHPLCAAEVARDGLGAHFGRYVQRLGGVASGRGLRLGMWADMLALLPGAIAHLPPGIIAYDWYYYPFGLRPRIELRNFAEYDLEPALRARGIEYWGCPMNGSFRHEPLPVFGERLANIRDWWRRCSQVKAGGFLVTSWEPNRLAMAMTTVVDAAAASLWLDPEVDDTPGMLARGFGRVFGGGRTRELARDALACDERAFVGYSRWEINERWDTCATRRGVSRFEAERAFFGRLLRRRPALPRPFRASVAFRRYVAERDVYVRATAAGILSPAPPPCPAPAPAIPAWRAASPCCSATRATSRPPWGRAAGPPANSGGSPARPGRPGRTRRSWGRTREGCAPCAIGSRAAPPTPAASPRRHPSAGPGCFASTSCWRSPRSRGWSSSAAAREARGGRCMPER